jgi:ubiquinone/menaquinone biosynthesis C-methylase UbiE
LELCSGTGKQTEYLLELFPNSTISCLDISIDAINTVKNNFKDKHSRMSFFVKGIDEFFESNKARFDLVFCSYGLYYSKNIEFVLNSIYNLLNKNGRLMVMGPFGKNNKQLFDILTKLDVTIPQPVIHSSSKFMYEDVLGFAVNNYESVHIHTTQNRIEWKTVESVMSYWKSSTFFNESRENDFQQLVANEIGKNGVFVNDKHIMLLIAIK